MKGMKQLGVCPCPHPATCNWAFSEFNPRVAELYFDKIEALITIVTVLIDTEMEIIDYLIIDYSFHVFSCVLITSSQSGQMRGS